MVARGLSAKSIAAHQGTGGLPHAPKLALPAVGPQRNLFRQHGKGGRRGIQITRAVEAPPSPYVPPPPPPSSSPEIPRDELKALLLDTLFGSERGLTASSEIRAEVNEIITQLEAKNPNPSLEAAGDVLNGQWKLVYTSNSELIALLALNRLPFFRVGDITQTIDSLTMTAVNTVSLTVPFSRTSLSTSASFEIRSPKRLQVRFEKGTIATPQLLQDVELPSSVSVLGQPIDLTPLKSALQPVNDVAQGAVRQLASLISQQPDLQFPISAQSAQTWLINTYLDEDTRISRGDGGSVFVMVKDVSLTPVMPPPTGDAAEEVIAEAMFDE